MKKVGKQIIRRNPTPVKAVDVSGAQDAMLSDPGDSESVVLADAPIPMAKARNVSQIVKETEADDTGDVRPGSTNHRSTKRCSGCQAETEALNEYGRCVTCRRADSEASTENNKASQADDPGDTRMPYKCAHCGKGVSQLMSSNHIENACPSCFRNPAKQTHVREQFTDSRAQHSTGEMKPSVANIEKTVKPTPAEIEAYNQEANERLNKPGRRASTRSAA